MDSVTRKRARYCPHCSEIVTYLVYKRHKEEFYDARKKEWTTCHITSNLYMKELDAVDDEIICNALASSHKGIPHSIFLHCHVKLRGLVYHLDWMGMVCCFTS